MPNVLGDVLEPLEARLGGTLDAFHHRPALSLISEQRRIDAGVFMETCGERQRILHREFRPGTDREVGSVGGISDQQHVAVPPGAGANSYKTNPAAVVADQRLSLQHVGEHLGTEGHAALVAFAWFPGPLRRVHLAASPPAGLLELDDECAHRVAVGVGVRLHGARVRFGDKELERIKDERRAEPHVARVPGVELLMEGLCTRLSGEAVDAIGAHDKVI